MERIPILRLGELLLVSIQVDMHDELALTLQNDLTASISRHGSKGVLIDISSLDMVDSFIGRMLANIAQMARVLDAQAVITGMQPAVAITLVELGMSLAGVRTALDIERGMAMLRGSIEGSAVTPGPADGARSGRAGRRMTIPPDEVIEVHTSSDVVLVRQSVRRLASGLGFSLIDQTKIVTAASELARNTLEHGGGGSVRVQSATDGPRPGVRLVFEDAGPGIADVDRALTDGYSTGNGLGLGLSGSKRLVDQFELWTEPARGTRVTVTKWK